MKKVFLLDMSGEYGVVNTKDDLAPHHLSFNGNYISDWKDYDWYYLYTKFKKGDFFFGSGFGIFDKTMPIVEGLLSKYCQFLPISISGKEHFLANVTHFCDCFDFENSQYRNKDIRERVTISGKEALEVFNSIDDINRVLFKYGACLKASKIDAPIFYTKDRNHYMGPYVTSGFFPEEEEFYHLVQKENLKGLEFIEVQLSE